MLQVEVAGATSGRSQMRPPQERQAQQDMGPSFRDIIDQVMTNVDQERAQSDHGLE